MVSLSKLRNRTADRGEWVTINEEEEPFQVSILPLGSEFQDRHYEIKQAAARRLNRGPRSGTRFYSADDIPPSEQNLALAKAIGEKVLVGVAGLSDDDGSAVTLEQMQALIQDPVYFRILVMIHAAALVLTSQASAEREDAAGNLHPASAGT